MWRDYFKLKGLKPGRVITELCGEIDFSRDNIPVEIIRKLYENDFPYLELTEKGKEDLYGIILNKKENRKDQTNVAKSKSIKRELHKK